MPQVITKDDAQTAAEQAAEVQAAQVAAQAAFASVDEPDRKPEKAETKAETPKKTDAEMAAETKAAEEAAAEAEWEGVPAKVRQTLEVISGKVGALDKLQHDFKSLAGRTGAALEGVNALKAAMETAKSVKKDGGDAPTQEQIAAAAASDQEWNTLKEDFPEWSEATDKRIDQRVEARLAKLVIPPAVDAAGLKTEVTQSMSEQITKATSQARELMKIDRKHENWAQDIYINGENAQGGFTPAYAEWEARQPPEIKALAESNKAADAIKMLDLFYERRNALAETTAKKEHDKKRLDSAITPKGVASPATRNLSDEEAKLQGFLSVDT